MPFDGVGMPEVTERLVLGRSRIKAGWCQGSLNAYRLTWQGWRHEYCLVGAMLASAAQDHASTVMLASAAQDHVTAESIKFVKRAIGDLGYGRIHPAEFNDSHSQAQVLEVCDVAIAMSQGDYRPSERRNP